MMDGGSNPEPLVARFLMRELQSSDGINDLLALLEAPQQSLARQLAIRTADKGYWRADAFCRVKTPCEAAKATA
jgi:hypothetical protein